MMKHLDYTQSRPVIDQIRCVGGRRLCRVCCHREKKKNKKTHTQIKIISSCTVSNDTFLRIEINIAPLCVKYISHDACYTTIPYTPIAIVYKVVREHDVITT